MTHADTVTTSPVSPARVDPRGPRFGAAVTTVVLAAALLLVGSPIGLVVLGWQTLVFALGALVGLQAQPYSWLFRTFVRPRLAPPTELEDARPPRFAQTVGLVFALVALVASIAGADVVATVAIALALLAAFLNAAFSFCLGCEMYLFLVRLRRR